ncbi:hypothetical protein BJV82DRAFT_563071 [Fennellomyces sp. T-0311]|nr:hypothetical protein BJV82DRAFT_563071 [Fennellomyces sp. T-0311]
MTMNSNDVSKRLHSLLGLLDQKRLQPSNSDLETRFFNDALEFLLNDSTDHWWCTEIQPIVQESLWFFSLPDHENIKKYKDRLASQLQNCTRCLQNYYASKPILKKRYNRTFSAENVTSFFDTLDRFDRYRALTTLQQNVYTQSNFFLSNNIICTLYDILNAPHFLRENDSDTLFCNLFNEIHQTGRFPTFGTEVANGIIIFAFHHHRVVRTWARKLLDRFASDGFLLDFPDITVRMTPQWLSKPDLVSTDAIRLTTEIGERTKAFRVAATVLSPDKLRKIMDSATPSIQQWILDLLAVPGNNVQETIRCMSVLLQKLGHGFWNQDVFAAEGHRSLFKRICDDPAFLKAMTIAKEETAGNIKQRDGSAYPQDKLIARIKSMLEWIYLYWQALPSRAQDEIAGTVLDWLWNYFQQSTWAIGCRAYCAQLGFQVVEESMARDKCPHEKINEYASIVIQFSSSHGRLPDAFQGLPSTVSDILTQLLRQDAIDLRQRIIALSQSSDAVPRTGCEALWNAIGKTRHIDERIVAAAIQGYSQLVIVDIPFSNATVSTDGRLLMQHMQKIRQTLCHLLNSQGRLCESTEMTQPILELMCSPHEEIRTSIIKLLSNGQDEQQTFRHFFDKQSRQALEGFTTILDYFNNLSMPLTALDSFHLVAPLNRTLSHLISALVGDQDSYMNQLVVVGDYGNEEHRIIKEFWDTCWRTMALIFGNGMKWSETHKPKQVVDAISTLLDTAHMMMNARQLFQKAVESSTPMDTSFDDASQLQHDHVNQTIDSLSHWVYVTRTQVIQKLVPLLSLMLKHLKHLHVKISVDTYERLMSAATGVDDTRLSEADKEKLFIDLSAHQPTNTIFIDDSDDELEWQLVEPSESVSPSRPPAPQKITSYFTKADEPVVPMLIENDQAPENLGGDMDQDDEFFDEFGDLDISALPDEIFDVNPTVPEPNTSKPATASRKSIASAIQKQQTDLWKQHEEQKAKEAAEHQRRQQQVIQQQRHRRQQQLTFVPKAPEKPSVYAVTSTGRKLRQPQSGFSKLRALREEFKAERKLVAASKSPSASARKDQDSSSGSDDSDDDNEDGLQDLVDDNNKRAIEEERASVKELFAQPAKRSTKLIETQETKMFMQKRELIKQADQRRKKVTPDIDRFFKSILSWDITANTEMPPGAYSDMYRNVDDTYESYQDYFGIFEPLLLLEVWMNLLRARETLTENDVIERCIIDSRCHVNDFVDVTFTVTLSSVNSLMTDDLVCVANHFGNDFFRRDEVSFILAEPHQRPASFKGRMFLGKIMSIIQRKIASEVTVRCFFSPDRIILLNSLSPKTTWRILRLTSITTAQREYAALQGLEHYDLAKDVLHPAPCPMPMISDQAIHKCIDKYGVNEPQAQAILGALYKKQGFTLIQGPPGTGKTKTILGLIVSLLDEQRDRNRLKERGVRIDKDSSVYSGEGKILICAPSNAAVDEIAKRLQDGIVTAHGLCKPNVVRIGTPESANASVRELLLDRLVEKELAPLMNNADDAKDFIQRRNALSEDIRKVQLDIDDTERQIAESSASEMSRIPQLKDRRTKLVAERNKYKYMIKGIVEAQRDFNREQDMSKNRARQKVFANADIVCATLSGSGHEMLTSLALSFETVIVDEAAQSVEISSLIPLKYDCKRCVLVGDPNQLPPTVLSQMAAKYSYEQSLFMRLQKGAPSNVYLLSIQYRMHPEISSFPSKLFYASRLLNGPDMESITAAPWHSQHYFPPYRFYNVEQGLERMGYGKSLYNPAEAEAALALVDMLANNLPQVKFAYKIGIITPYKQQLSHLKHKFEGRYGSKILDVIDFNTVDGFQGQEKDIIIFSCVRAMSERGIGFLADMRRMNVGLTRAKSSLFVLGHKLSLKQSQLWGDLVQDAIERGRIEDVRQPYFNHRLVPGHKPSNLFEKEDKPKVATRKLLPRNKAQRIAIPSDNGKRSRAGSPVPPESSPPPKKIRATTPETDNRNGWTSVIPFTTNKLAPEQPKKPLPPPRKPSSSTPSRPMKMTLAQYRSTRGLSTSKPSSLYIQKRKPLPQQPAQSEDDIGARDRVILQHQAAKDAMRQIRLNEQQARRQKSTMHRQSATTKSMDDLLSDIRR